MNVGISVQPATGVKKKKTWPPAREGATGMDKCTKRHQRSRNVNTRAQKRPGLQPRKGLKGTKKATTRHRRKVARDKKQGPCGPGPGPRMCHLAQKGWRKSSCLGSYSVGTRFGCHLAHFGCHFWKFWVPSCPKRLVQKLPLGILLSRNPFGAPFSRLWVPFYHFGRHSVHFG